MRLAMLGVSPPRLGGERLAAGRGRFVADVRPEGLLEAAVLRSPHAHARVLRVDAARAFGLPGVRAVLTSADVPASAVIPNRLPAPEGTAAYLQPAIARGGELRRTGPTSRPHTTRGPRAPICGIPPGARPLTGGEGGGGLGARGGLSREDILAPPAGLALGGPGRWREGRRENFIAA